MIVEIADVYPGPAENPDTRDEMETGRSLVFRSSINVTVPVNECQY